MDDELSFAWREGRNRDDRNPSSLGDHIAAGFERSSIRDSNAGLLSDGRS